MENEAPNPAFQRTLVGKSMEFFKYPQKAHVDNFHSPVPVLCVTHTHTDHPRKEFAVQHFLVETVIPDATFYQFPV